MCNSKVQPPLRQTEVQTQDIISQVGYSNKIDKHQENIINNLGSMNLYLCVLVVLFVAAALFFMARYINRCIHKKIERATQANILRMRQLQSSRGKRDDDA